MNYILRPNRQRIHKQDSWKTSAYAFVPYQTHFGELCGFADDVVAPGRGFGLHPHQNMEISTIVLRGTQKHRDDTGGEGLIGANAVQTMSAGSGIQHSEFNASDTEPFHSFQIWVYPRSLNGPPRHEQFRYEPAQKLNTVLLTLSPDRRSGSALINQEAFFSVSRLEAGKSVRYALQQPGNGVYIHNAYGSVAVADQTLANGDAIGVYDTDSVTLTGLADTELIFVEVPLQRGIEL